ncbi:hypothetical protein ACK8HX_11900 [Oryzobacter sp. R7]|uniref:hypothetical protein n=1 Tax=Oryzobacter faecalis TaxID=3388656 RepID=UPI00398D422F
MSPSATATATAHATAPSTATASPSTRELIKELAEIEDRTFAVRASMQGADCRARLAPELLRLSQREQQILAQLRRRRVRAG